MARLSSTRTSDIRHPDKRSNTPTATTIGEGSVPVVPRFEYSPHRAPQLRFDVEGETVTEARDVPGLAKLPPHERDALLNYINALKNREPWLEWSGKREEPGFVVDPVVLQTHERVSAQAIIQAVQREDVQRSLFAAGDLPYEQEIEFYQHEVDWSNRLILGDSLQVMASLARREDLAGRVQMIYLDPPYGIKFASNFQPQIGQRDVKDKDSDLTREPETVKAYRDTWQLGIHSYLTYLRDRLLLCRELLTDSGSIFVQISDENLHRVRCLLDEVFGAENFVAQIAFRTSGGLGRKGIKTVFDTLLWFAKDATNMKFRPLFSFKGTGEGTMFKSYERKTGERVPIENDADLEEDVVRFSDLVSSGLTPSCVYEFEFQERKFSPGRNCSWKTNAEGISRLALSNRLTAPGTTLQFVYRHSDFPVSTMTNMWDDTVGELKKSYVVQTSAEVIKRCILMTTDPGDLVFDPTCGSGTTARVAERWGRRWITCDTSRVALAIARQQILTEKFDQYRLKQPDAGVKGGFAYRTVPHVTLKSIAQNTHLDPIFAAHEPLLDARLAACNAALAEVAPETARLLRDKLSRKTKEVGKKSITDADRRRWELPAQWEHWTVPFDTDDAWPQTLADAVTAYRAAWRAKMDAVNACISAHAASEELVDQPETVRGVVRVSGPFTVEAVQPPLVSLGEATLFDSAPEAFDGAPEALESFEETAPPLAVREVVATGAMQVENVGAYLQQMVRLLSADGVMFPNNKRMKFSRLEAATLGHIAVHAEGRWHADGETDGEPDESANGAANVAVCIGPQYGSISAAEIVEAKRCAHRESYEHLVFAGFAFDAAATAEIERPTRFKIETHMAHIRPDVNPAMDGLLKNSGRDQLFSVFGAPRVVLHRHETPDAGTEYSVEMQGMDVYDPIKNEVTPTGAGKVAAWFVDGDYDGKTFCITQAFFPDRSAWSKLERALKGAIEADVWQQLAGTKSLPFAAGTHRRAAVKVIDPRGNEVMRVVAL